jgi:hypothetical protein
MIPGPVPALLALKIPKLEFTILTGLGLLRSPFARTRSVTIPSGVFDGMIALICPGPTNTGIAFTIVEPCVAVIETPPSVVERGNDRAGLEAGPSRRPYMVNVEPRAIAPPGKPLVSELAAFTTPR